MSEIGLELLAPAGDLTIAKAVIDAGADAVYFGGAMFGARAYARNFTIEEGRELIKYAHLHGAKAYITINTLLKNLEIRQELYRYVREYYEAGIDAVLVQDMGVLIFLHHYFPDLELHSSTQMTLGSWYGAQWLKQFGVKRVVASRELSYPELQEIHEKTGLDLEAFVHGALCVCYSGQCLMSSMFGGRSGNRGRCAQPCRLPYQVYDAQGKAKATKGPYMLSMKDLCGVEDIPELDQAGVYSLKIEGRMKQMSYAQGVVNIYRQAIDTYLANGPKARVSSETKNKLFRLGNRNGFTDVWYTKQNSEDMLTYTEASHHHQDEEIAVIEEEKNIIHGTFTAFEGCEMCLSVWDDDDHYVTAVGDVVTAASKRAAEAEDVNQRLRKTGATSFEFDDLELTLGDNLFLPVGALNALRRDALEQLEAMILDMGQRRVLEYDPAYIANDVEDDNVDQVGIQVVVSSLDQLSVVLQEPMVTTLIVESELLGKIQKDSWDSLIAKLHKNGRQIIIKLPIVLRSRGAKFLDSKAELMWHKDVDGYMVSTIDGLGYLDEHEVAHERVWLNHRMYTWSDWAVKTFRDMGYIHMTAPAELNAKELGHRDNRGSAAMVYGYLPLMVTTNCIHKDCDGCDHQPGLMYLEDRKNKRFPVNNHCAFCYNTIHNSLPTSLLDNMEQILAMGMEAIRLDFTVEDEQTTRQVLKTAVDAFTGHGDGRLSMETTRGHFRRGVE